MTDQTGRKRVTSQTGARAVVATGLATLLAVAGCEALLDTGSLSERIAQDGGGPDATTANSSEARADTGVPDEQESATPDMDAPDGGASDMGAIDGGVLDGAALDMGALDGGAIDGGALDSPVGPSPVDGGCPSGWSDCGGACVSLSGSTHCGSCSNDCTQLPNVNPASASCNAGHCSYTCATHHADCADAGAGCPTDLSAAATCGACATACPADSPVCTATGSTYACETGCPSPTPTRCNGACVDEQSDDSNCNGCGAAFACSGGRTCQSGACTCPASLPTNCGGTCASTTGTDAKNCGACGHSCQGGTCAGGVCQPIALAPGAAASLLAVGSSNVYYISGSSLMKVAAGGGGTPIALATGLPTVAGVATDSTNVYWVEPGTGSNGEVLKVSVNGGTSSPLSTGLAGGYSIAVLDGYVLWVAASDGTVKQVPIGGGTTSTISSGQDNPVGIATDSSHVYWANAGTVYFASIPSGARNTSNSTFTISQVTAQNVGSGPALIATDGTSIYVIGPGSNGETLEAAPVGGGTVSTLASGLGGLGGMAVDSTGVYLTTLSVERIPLGGGTPVTLPTTTSTSKLGTIALDSTSIYWTSSNGVMQLAK